MGGFGSGYVRERVALQALVRHNCFTAAQEGVLKPAWRGREELARGREAGDLSDLSVPSGLGRFG